MKLFTYYAQSKIAIKNGFHCSFDGAFKITVTHGNKNYFFSDILNSEMVLESDMI